MTRTSVSASKSSNGLASALRAIRRHRQRRPGDLAEALRLPRRSYEHFEAGGGRLNTDRVQAFAEATQSDAYAIFASLWIASPEFAVRCADNKLMTILIMALQDFDAAAGDDIARLDARTLITAFDTLFQTLTAEAQHRNVSTDAEIVERLRRLAPPPKSTDE
ncbi:MAG: XRE family transcriptional regulator [Phenylobacterium sp.]|uniref:XRE family transcriptional regulator n=1 Tax=Phenylobacterium sp. TaxID=1871053 RepID=UPI001B692A3C|nr:XRE family transcriptional regulator [Phenylobacterium sp.]MBP7817139.1 XRE family transcriptional regulator [Phenylobacterium sp.]